jgi:hypothetical protein
VTWTEAAGLCGGIIVAIASAAYIVDVLRGGSRPQRVSWAVWSVIGVLGLGASTSGGAGAAAYPAAVYAVAYVVTFLLSLSPRYAKPGGERYDIPLLVLALVGVLLWRFGPLTDGPAVALAIVCDGAALWPTLRGAWHDPSTESRSVWTFESLGNALALAALTHASFAAVAYPVYLLAATASVAIVLAIRRAPKVERSGVGRHRRQPGRVAK